MKTWKHPLPFPQKTNNNKQIKNIQAVNKWVNSLLYYFLIYK